MSEREGERKEVPSSAVSFGELSEEENEEYAKLSKELEDIYKDKENKEERAPRKRAIVERVTELQEKAWSASSLAERIRKDCEEVVRKWEAQ